MFTKIRDWEDQVMWRSHKHNNGEFDFWITIKLLYLEDYKDFAEKYHMQMMVIAPSQVPPETRDSYLGSLGLNEFEQERAASSDEGLVEFLCESGCGAPVWSELGNNKQTLYKEAKQQAMLVGRIFFGFYMDKYVNMIGTTGWDMLKGDVEAGLRRYREEQEQTNEAD